MKLRFVYYLEALSGACLAKVKAAHFPSTEIGDRNNKKGSQKWLILGTVNKSWRHIQLQINTSARQFAQLLSTQLFTFNRFTQVSAIYILNIKVVKYFIEFNSFKMLPPQEIDKDAN
jgi:hypothetical protein